MNISRVDMAAKQNFGSNTRSIGGIQLPNFNSSYVYSQNKTDTSSLEYGERIKKQAYMDYANGKFQNMSANFNRLLKSYVSEVSPNRKGIITSGLTAVSKKSKIGVKPIDFVATLMEGKVIYQKSSAGNNVYMEFYDKNGEKVAKYSNNGWTMLNTKAETARQIELCSIYNKAWNEAKSSFERERNIP